MSPHSALPMTSRLGVIVTTYKPDAQFFARFAETLAACGRFIVVDNTPGGYRFGDVPSDKPIEILQDGQNKGLGRALNLGIEAARQAGFDTVMLFDQDSTPDLGFLRRMLRTLDAASDAGARNVCIGPLHVDDAQVSESSPGLEQDEATATSRLQAVTCLATSGMLFRIDRLRSDELFTEDFFLDFVDFDWCWRLGQRGWKFYKALGVTMPHRLGLAQRHFFGLTYHVPAPYRHYFQFRDTLRLALRPYVPLYSKIRLAGILPLKALAYPFLLDRGRERVHWMARGVADAFLQVGGVGAARETLNH